MCEKCLYKNNCQFLAKHKTVEVEGCTAFISEDEYRVTIKNEVIKEFAERLKEKAWIGMWETISHVDVDDIDNLVEKMTRNEVNETVD